MSTRRIGEQSCSLPAPLETLSEALPLATMVRGILEWALDDAALEQLALEAAPSGEMYTRELMISTLVWLLIQVSAGNRASLFAAYQADAASEEPQVTVSYQAMYAKLGRVSPLVSEALVRHASARLGELIGHLTVGEEPLAGYRARVVDGNVLTGTDHRLAPLRDWAAACLPGKSLVVYEPASGLVSDLVLCEDAYTQERSLVKNLLPRFGPGDLGLFDRNFCTTAVVFGLDERSAHFIIRQHRSTLHLKPLGKFQPAGEVQSGTVWEQPVQVSDPATGRTLVLRRVQLRLHHKTRDGERNINLLTNLPAAVAAGTVARVYKDRWTVERHFQFLTESLSCEQPGLGKPRAALLAFAMALVAGNALAVVRAALRQAHGVEAEQEISAYYLADEVAADYRPLMKLAPPPQWSAWRGFAAAMAAYLLVGIAQHVNLKALQKHSRAPKPDKRHNPRRVSGKGNSHRATSRLLAAAENKNTC
jgi:hypothetical protein